jgi:hypothetical protein
LPQQPGLADQDRNSGNNITTLAGDVAQQQQQNDDLASPQTNNSGVGASLPNRFGGGGGGGGSGDQHQVESTIAFTEILSVQTLETSGVQELLRDRSSVDNLLRWHINRTKTPSTAIARFAERFSDAARECIDQRFKECIEILESLANDKAYPEEYRNGEPMEILYQTAQLYVDAPPPAKCLYNGCFFLKAKNMHQAYSKKTLRTTTIGGLGNNNIVSSPNNTRSRAKSPSSAAAAKKSSVSSSRQKQQQQQQQQIQSKSTKVETNLVSSRSSSTDSKKENASVESSSRRRRLSPAHASDNEEPQ